MARAPLKRAPGRNLALMQSAERRLRQRLASFFAESAQHVSRQISEQLGVDDAGEMGEGPQVALFSRENSGWLEGGLWASSSNEGKGKAVFPVQSAHPAGSSPPYRGLGPTDAGQVGTAAYAAGDGRALPSQVRAISRRGEGSPVAAVRGRARGNSQAGISPRDPRQLGAGFHKVSPTELDDVLSEPAKVRRDAFLYLGPAGRADRFAQCGTCGLFRLSLQSCVIVADRIVAEGSCGLYAHGTPADDQPQRASVTQTDAGYVVREVRCENCRFFASQSSVCSLYADLNEAFPDIFDLATRVDAQGCCNAQTPMALSKSSDHPGGLDLHVKPENAVPINLPQRYPDPVTRANLWHVAWSMVQDGEFATKRVVVPLDVLIPTQQVVDKERVAKHEAALLAGEGVEPQQKPPLAVLWDGDYFLLGGHHGTQAARNLGVKEMTVDLMVAPS